MCAFNVFNNYITKSIQSSKYLKTRLNTADTTGNHSNNEQNNLIVYLGGGPGCSSLTSVLGRNGPYIVRIVYNFTTKKTRFNFLRDTVFNSK